MQVTRLMHDTDDLSSGQIMVDTAFRGMKDLCRPGSPVWVWEVASPTAPEQMVQLSVLYIPNDLTPFLPTSDTEIEASVRTYDSGGGVQLEIDLLNTAEPTIVVHLSNPEFYRQTSRTIIYIVDRSKRLRGLLILQETSH